MKLKKVMPTLSAAVLAALLLAGLFHRGPGTGTGHPPYLPGVCGSYGARMEPGQFL